MTSEGELGLEWTVKVTHTDGRVEQEVIHNLIPTEGLTHIMGVAFKGAAQVLTWYLSLFEGNYTPNAGLTAAAYPAAATECTAYQGSTRIEFNEGSVVAGAVDNSANPAKFTFTANKTVYGGVMSSASAKGATTGVLTSAVRFTSPKVCEAGATLEVIAGNSLISA